MMQNAFFFIPDISGFTSFVTQTEQVHSRHLIAELLEQVIAADTLSLTLQEIEGDAIFFLRTGPTPTRAEVFAQARRMFLAFHTHLRVIERDNVCQCGACRTVSNLTLKFVAHYGELEQVQVAGRSTVSGADVILVHRLLKNGIPEREYLLLTKSLSAGDEMPGADPPAEHWRESLEEVEHFSAQSVQWMSLSSLHEDIPPAEILPPYEQPGGRVHVLHRRIRAPLLLVHDLLTDPEKKKEYTPGLRESRSDSPINRVRTTHTCIFDDFEVHFVTRESRREGSTLIFTESAEASFGFSLVFDYRLRGDGSETEFRVRILPGTVDGHGQGGLRGRVLTLLKPLLSRYTAWTNLRRFSAYCEKVAAERSTDA
ncbi:MAG: DUF2652 domain-containing protein [Bacteroidota bacterium]|nr:DUF2652 domain-containing protein [Bacteroidota bacterium]